MIADTKPSAILVRVTRDAGRFEGTSITLDTSANIKNQRELSQNVRNLCEALCIEHGLRAPVATDTVEIISGRTANRIERMEDLLNDCRNVLVQIDGDEPDDTNIKAQLAALFVDLDAELGL